MPLKALIVDDERHARSWLRRLLDEQPGIDVVAEADGVDSAMEALQVYDVDLVFLDIQMPPDTGFDLLPHLPPVAEVIFITAYDDFAIKAFEARALDYLLKPVHPERLADSVARALIRHQDGSRSCQIINNQLNRAGDSGSFSLGDAPLQLEDLLPLKDRNVLRVITVSSISAIQAQGAYTRIFISGIPAMMILCAISEWESKLPSPPFARLDRSHIINLTQIQEAVTVDRNQTQLRLRDVESSFDLGRAASQRLRFLLG